MPRDSARGPPKRGRRPAGAANLEKQHKRSKHRLGAARRPAARPNQPVLRPYQRQAVNDLRAAYAAGYEAPVLQLATAAGKTIIFAEVTRGAWSKGRRVLVLVHRRELIRQASKKLTLAGVPHGIIAAGFAPRPNELVQGASIQTAARRSLPDFNLIVIDECHHAVAPTWRSVIAKQPHAKILGVTATPARLDGKGLGKDAGGIFDAIVSGPSIRGLTSDGYLSPYRCFVPKRRLDLVGVRTRAGDFATADLAERVDRPEIAGDAVAQYRLLADHRPAIAFCVTVEHAERVAETFRAAGYRSAAVHGGLDTRERDRLIGGLSTGEVEILTSCEIIGEGLDVPNVGAVILLRPTKSLVLHLQQIGRGMRPAPSGDALIVLDLAANTLRHGLPDMERRWSLAGAEKPEGDAPVRVCPNCGAVNPLGAVECELCGEEFPRPRGRGIIEVVDSLAELTPHRLAAVIALPYRRVISGRFSEAELRAYAQSRGCKRGWVFYRLREQRGEA